MPGRRRIVLQVGRGGVNSGDLTRVLRHELAHLALRERVRARLPRWFEEGYAGTAAGEWHHAQVLQLNMSVARGRVWPLAEVDRILSGRQADAAQGQAAAQGPDAAQGQAAAQAYALAASAVQLLMRWGGPGGIDRLVAALESGQGFPAALRATFAVTPEQFEALWRQDLRKRYGWLGLAAAAGLVWTLLGLFAACLFLWRRRRDRARRARLDAQEHVSEVLDDQALQF